MNPRTLWKLAALSLTLVAPTALASSWRDDGNLRRKKVRSYEEAEREAQDRGLSFGFRSGYGLPFGEFGSLGNTRSAKLSDTLSGGIPLQVDAGYFFNSHLYLGASFQYGVGLLAEDCQGGVSCSASQLRFGVNLAYHFQPTEQLEPWVGVGIGYEMLDMSVASNGLGMSALISTSVRGFEFASLQGGLDYRVTRRFSVGPFVTLTGGQYSTVSSRIELEEENPLFEDVESTDDIRNQAFHAWLYGGVRMNVRF